MLVSVGLNQLGATVAVREMLASSGDALAARLSTRNLTPQGASIVELNRTLMRAALEDRAQAAGRAGEIVAEEVAWWARDEAGSRAAPLIQGIRSRATAIAREEVDRAVRGVQASGRPTPPSAA